MSLALMDAEEHHISSVVILPVPGLPYMGSWERMRDYVIAAQVMRPEGILILTGEFQAREPHEIGSRSRPKGEDIPEVPRFIDYWQEEEEGEEDPSEDRESADQEGGCY